jgi:hypothetical protein
MMIRLLVLGSLLGAAIGALAQAPALFVGTWKLDLARSSFGAAPAPRSDTTVMKAVEGGFSVVTDRVDAEGKAIHYEYTAKFDGKDYPVTGTPRYDAIAVTRIDERTFDWVMKKDGKLVSQGRTTYSPDGKSRILTYPMADASGRKSEVRAVFGRQ